MRRGVILDEHERFVTEELAKLAREPASVG